MNLHFAIDRPTLVRQINNVINARADHGQKPVLGNALLEIKGDIFRLACTDIIIELRAGGKVTNIAKEDGSVTVPAKKLHDLVSTLADTAGQVEFKNDGGPFITLTIPHAHYKLATLPVEDFPASQQLESVTKVTLQAPVMLGLINKVRHAMGKDDVRAFLNGMLVDIEGSRIMCVASDGHRLAAAHGALSTAVETPMHAIISRRGVEALLNFLRDAEGEFTMEFSAKFMRSQVGDRGMVAALLEGQFPDYKQVIPRANPYTVTVNRTEFLSAVQRMGMIASENLNKPITLHLGDKGFSLTAKGAKDEQNGSELIDADCPKADMHVGLNSTYLIDALGATDAEKITIQLKDYCSAILIAPVVSDGSGFVVMPLRV